MEEKINNKHITVSISEEMKKSYLGYAMSVIVGRALPDVRDGLKPVHRRVLYSMNQLNIDWNKPYKKSARIVGDVIGKYHPHGDVAVYDTIVRMAQPFSLRYTLIDGQGNFGSVDGDAPAAMRYTEIRMTKIAHDLMEDLDNDTVDFSPNYDESEFEPVVMPTRVPNLLINGMSGIAVGMATNIAPHNISEVINACLALIDNPELDTEGILQYIKGPDFPTGGIINGIESVKQAYETGRGRVVLRSKWHLEELEQNTIVVTELPYQVNKARLIEHIYLLIKDKKIEGIHGLRDESDKDGMRIIIELKNSEIPEVIINNLYSMSQLQNNFSINMVALDKGEPKLMNLKSILMAFIDHRIDVVTRRSLFLLKKIRKQAHILEGLAVALNNIDNIIELIKNAKSSKDAKEQLLAASWNANSVISLIKTQDVNLLQENDEIKNSLGLQENGDYLLSPEQAQAILDLRLHRLTALEQEKIFNEFKDLIKEIKNLLEILQNPDRLMLIIKEELKEIEEKYRDNRRSEIIEKEINLSYESLITEEQRVITLSHSGYVKAQSLEEYKPQHRGGVGKIAAKTKEEDFVKKVFTANSHDTMLCFSSLGKVYWLKVYKIPKASRLSRGKPIVNLLNLEKNETINAVLPIKEYTEDLFIIMGTKFGICKKTKLTSFSNERKTGIIAVTLNENDSLIDAYLSNDKNSIMLFTNFGKAIHFSEKSVRSVSRTGKGVMGIRLKKGDKIVSMLVADKNNPILTVTENGYGKKTDISEYRIQNRAGQGYTSINTSKRNGKVISAVMVDSNDDIILISNKANLVRIQTNTISTFGRNTQGVRLIKLEEKSKLISIAKIEKDEE